MHTTEFDHLWSERKNWKLGLVYSCKEDPRIIVPKKPRWMGQTLNFAHAKSYAVLAATIFAIATPMPLLAAVTGTIASPLWIACLVATVIAIVVFYYRADLRA
jgi:hypothetical protein